MHFNSIPASTSSPSRYKLSTPHAASHPHPLKATDSSPSAPQAGRQTSGSISEALSMASGEEAPAAAAVQTFVLRVSIHCPACKKKVRKVLKSVEGVHNVTVDGAQNKVTVTGTVDADTLVRRLYKSGKQAMPWQPPAAVPKKTEAAPEALPAPPAGDGGKDDAAADKKPEEQPVKEPQAESSEKKPEAENETESEKKAEKEEAKPSDEAKKDGGESEAADPAKEAAVDAAKETGNDEDEANTKSKPKDAGEAEPAAAVVERSLSPAPAPAPKHVHEEYYPYYAPQPVLSYHMAQPSASMSYYAPRPEPAYSVQQQPPQPAYSVQQPQPQPMQQWSPSYLYMPYPHAAPESYYHDHYSPPGTHSSPPPPQDSYRIFDDENPNSCSVM